MIKTDSFETYRKKRILFGLKLSIALILITEFIIGII